MYFNENLWWSILLIQVTLAVETQWFISWQPIFQLGAEIGGGDVSVLGYHSVKQADICSIFNITLSESPKSLAYSWQGVGVREWRFHWTKLRSGIPYFTYSISLAI